jgi:glycine/D-amino acid oxidase-like deaminating enzyme
LAVDVAVIGAGIHGASAAFPPGKAGAQVAVGERLTPAAGPTGLSQPPQMVKKATG